MFNKSGQVIGINAFGVEESQGLNFAVHIDEVLDFIKQVENGNYPVESDNVYEKELWSIIDFNKNGNDGFILNNNGSTWVKHDSDEDGIIDIWMFDTNGDDNYDILTYDKNNDGDFEYYIIDEDFNGEPDSIGIDTNGDMLPDLNFVYSKTLLK